MLSSFNKSGVNINSYNVHLGDIHKGLLLRYVCIHMRTCGYIRLYLLCRILLWKVPIPCDTAVGRPMEDMFHLPYFDSWSRRWTKGEIITLPPLDVFENDLSLISELPSFAKNRPTKSPTTHKRTFQLLYLADFLCVKGLVSFVADKLSVEPDRLVCGPIRKIRSLVHGRYRQHQHGCAVTDLMKCSLCNLSITNDVPAKAEWFEIPCCSKFLHLHCKESCTSL